MNEIGTARRRALGHQGCLSSSRERWYLGLRRYERGHKFRSTLLIVFLPPKPEDGTSRQHCSLKSDNVRSFYVYLQRIRRLQSMIPAASELERWSSSQARDSYQAPYLQVCLAALSNHSPISSSQATTS